ncbi:hypothetical protein IW261DRAFT_1472469 [Armillaria novae-zelandiae]|uniref:Uncharacterized protein n=1 Tax=Armillaria novae-zelandiae TaxID=153914 RepID=A0AA39PCM1_9AGAR|nr:hypothetical protein IW261DRAFT_1472469 [Armillaria novae-zelandiae]
MFFTYPEWYGARTGLQLRRSLLRRYIYGGIGLGVAAVAIINMFALSNRSYIWTRVCKFLWPFIIVISAVRAILMIVELERGKDKIQWECDNGGQLWTASAAAGYSTSTSFPSTFCSSGFSSLYTAFIISLLADLGCQMYMFFLNWRFSKRLEHYSNMKGPFHGGELF